MATAITMPTSMRVPNWFFRIAGTTRLATWMNLRVMMDTGIQITDHLQRSSTMSRTHKW